MEHTHNNDTGFAVNDYVVYGSSGVCRLVGIEERSFDDVTHNEYFKLIPLNCENSTYYVPIDSVQSKLRDPLTKEDVYSLIDSLPSEEMDWIEDNRERKLKFDEYLKSDDYTKIMSMLRALYLHQKNQRSCGKKLMAVDEGYMKAAENRMYQEFAFVLGIEVQNVEEFIIDRTEKTT